MQQRRLVIVTSLILAIVASVPAPASANSSDPLTGGSTVTVEDSEGPIKNAAQDAIDGYEEGSGVSDPCDYVVAIEDDLATAVWDLNNVEPVTVSLGDFSDPERRVSVGQSTAR